MKLGLIGCGKMGGALLRGVVKAGLVKPAQLTACDKFASAASVLAKEFKGLKSVKTPAEVAAASDVILLAVKPQDMQKLLQGLAEIRNPKSEVRNRLFLSIAA